MKHPNFSPMKLLRERKPFGFRGTSRCMHFSALLSTLFPTGFSTLFPALFFGLLSTLLGGMTACTPSSSASSSSDREDNRSSELWDSLTTNPRYVCDQLRNQLPSVTDSLDYYSDLMLLSKAYQIQGRMDSMEYFTHRTELFCHRRGWTEQLPETSGGDSRRAEYFDLLGEVCNMRGNLWMRLGRTDSAVVAYHRSLQARLQGRRHGVLPDVAINLADTYSQRGQYDQAAKWYRQALSYADSLGVPETDRFPEYYGLATVYTHLRDFEAADRYFDAAYRYYDRMQPSEKHFYLNNRGNSYYYREDYPKALEMFRRMLALAAEQPQMEFERHLTELNMGETFLLMDQPDSAEHYLNRCSGYFRTIGHVSALYYLDTQLIELALQQHNLPLARKRLAEAVKLPQVDPSMLHIRNRYLQHYFEQSGDYRQAYHYQRLNQHIDDSIRNERVQMRTAEAALKYQQDTTLMKQKIFIQQKENEVLSLNQKLYGWVAVSIAIALLLVVIYFYSRRQRLLLEVKSRNEMAALRMENIRNRLSPHFIFNVLNRQMGSFSDEQADRMHGLVKLMRRNLELSEQLCVTLAEELDFVKTYIELERPTLEPDFVCQVDCDPTLDLQQTLLPSMLLQIPVENAIKHALRGKEGPRRLWIDIRRTEGATLLRVVDNGGGYRVQSARRGTGTGLKVIRQTILLMNARNRRPIDLQVSNLNLEGGEVGCEFRVVLPEGFDYQLK